MSADNNDDELFALLGGDEDAEIEGNQKSRHPHQKASRPDKRLERYTGLLQVAFTARMLESHAHPASEHPMPELQRAQGPLLRILQQQVEELADDPSIRPGSATAWRDYRLPDFDTSSTLSYNPDLFQQQRIQP
jgi:hypothetical protein